MLWFKKAKSLCQAHALKENGLNSWMVQLQKKNWNTILFPLGTDVWWFTLAPGICAHFWRFLQNGSEQLFMWVFGLLYPPEDIGIGNCRTTIRICVSTTLWLIAREIIPICHWTFVSYIYGWYDCLLHRCFCLKRQIPLTPMTFQIDLYGTHLMVHPPYEPSVKSFVLNSQIDFNEAFANKQLGLL